MSMARDARSEARSPLRPARLAAPVLALALLLAPAAAFAAPPAGAGQPASPGQSSGQGTSAPSTQAAFGQSIAAAVQGALTGGAGGPALAEAVHEAIAAAHTNAKGLGIAMAIYADLSTGQAPPPPFTDLGQAPWATGAIGALAHEGIVQGTGTGQFSPSLPVTGTELETMLARLASFQNGGGAQPGVPAWAQAGAAYAQQQGIAAGIQGLSDINGPLTRAEAVTMLVNALGLGTAAAADSQAVIALQGTVPAWAHGSIALAIGLGLLQGSGGQIDASQVLTRAQMAVLLARMAYLEALATQSSSS